jgi:hypothetical protein
MRSTVRIADIEKGNEDADQYVTADRNRFENPSIPPQRDNDQHLRRRE